MDFYEKDSVRVEDREERDKIVAAILLSYRKLNYQVIKIPKVLVDERVDFIKKNIKVRL